MASSSSSRGPLAAANRPTTITLDEWESRTPLAEAQLASISTVRQASDHRPLPDKFSVSQPGSSTFASPSAFAPPSRPGTPQGGRRAASSSLLHNVLSPGSRPPSRPTTPSQQHLQAGGSGGGGGHHLASSIHSLASLSPAPAPSIATPQQFYDWFGTLTASLEHEQDALYRDYLAEIVGYRAACDALVDECARAGGVCDEMAESFRFVEERSKSLQAACEELLDEQSRLLTISETLSQRLSYFASLEPATRMLNAPGAASQVTSADFIPMIERIDECLAYLQAHRDYKDSELYILRYQQCLSRSMTMIRIHFVLTIKALGADVGKRLSEQNLSEPALRALLYAKPLALVPTLAPLVRELQFRAPAHRAAAMGAEGAAVGQLVGECAAAWVAFRMGVLGAVVNAEIGRMDPSRGDLVDLTRAGCGYLKQLCSDEFQLFRQLFATGGEDILLPFLETLCDYLYDYLRPRILHEQSITALCQVCTVVQALMVLDSGDSGSDADDDDDEADTDGRLLGAPGADDVPSRSLSPFSKPADDGSPASDVSPFSKPRARFASEGGTAQREDRMLRLGGADRASRRAHLAGLLRPVLQDAQTRLVFRAQALIVNDVGRFMPTEKDLNYPGVILKAAEKGFGRPAPADKPPSPRHSTADLASVVGTEDDDDEGALFRLPALEIQMTWYPSVRKTLWLLSELHSFIAPGIFEDLAQEAVSLCRQSLLTATDLLNLKVGRVDGGLFLVRHLLILKEMLSSVEMVQRDMGGDMLGVTDAFSAMLSAALSLLPSSLTFGYGAPAPASSARSGRGGAGGGAGGGGASAADDIKRELDRSLKEACEDLIAQATTASTAPVRAFLARASAFLASAAAAGDDGKRGELTAEEWATGEKVLAVHADARESMRAEVTAWVGKLRTYLEDDKAVDVLIPPMQSSIIDVYRPFHELVRAEYDFAVSEQVASPVRMWDFLRTLSVDAAPGGAACDARK